jgi:hypothetical protein
MISADIPCGYFPSSSPLVEGMYDNRVRGEYGIIGPVGSKDLKVAEIRFSILNMDKEQ